MLNFDNDGILQGLKKMSLLQSPQAGQIATFSCDEGESVEYKQSVIELAPFFGGHIIGESKWN